MKLRKFLLTTLIFAILNMSSHIALGQSLPVLRDSEIETILRQWSDPIFKAANLNPASVTIRLIEDSRLNAFVGGGQNIFLHSGLLIASDNPLQVIGVIAHETGHIAGGHLARSEEASRQAQTIALLHTLLGVGAAAVGSVVGATGSSEVGSALLSSGGATGMRHFLAFTRTQESAADQAAISFLEENKISARGLLGFLQKFENQDLLTPNRQDPYMRTHPLTKERIAFVKEHVENSEFSSGIISNSELAKHARIRAKLIGFLQPVGQTFRRYPADDLSVAVRYARAIAHYKDSNLEYALSDLDSLILEHSTDPYFHELRGQFLFESGRLEEAWTSYELANQLLPNDVLLMIELARLEIEMGGGELLDKAIGSLEKVSILEPRNNVCWWLLSIGYGRAGYLADSSLASAEQALLEGRPEDAVLHADRAIRGLENGSPRWLRANDVKHVAIRRSGQ